LTDHIQVHTGTLLQPI